jgi:hypothetical protein
LAHGQPLAFASCAIKNLRHRPQHFSILWRSRLPQNFSGATFAFLSCCSGKARLTRCSFVALFTCGNAPSGSFFLAPSPTTLLHTLEKPLTLKLLRYDLYFPLVLLRKNMPDSTLVWCSFHLRHFSGEPSVCSYDSFALLQMWRFMSAAAASVCGSGLGFLPTLIKGVMEVIVYLVYNFNQQPSQCSQR